MAKTREQKEQIVEEIKQKLDQVKTAVFSTFNNIDVAGQEDLRAKMREKEIVFHVYKKTLINKALEKAGIKSVDVNQYQGNIAIAFSNTDEVEPAKVLVEAGKDWDGLKVQEALINQEHLDQEKAIALAELPSRQELIAKTVGSIAAPLNGFLNVLNGNQRKLVNVLKQIKK